MNNRAGTIPSLVCCTLFNFELGLSATLLQENAYMFVRLHWLQGGRVGGESISEFNSFISSAVRIYGLISIIFIVFSYAVGAYIFNHRISLDPISVGS